MEYMWDLNLDVARRDKIIFGNPIREKYDTLRFEIDLGTLKMLVDENFIDLDCSQNDSPTAREFFELMQRFPRFAAHGYVVTDSRRDYRVTIEGLVLKGEHTEEELIAFKVLCHSADEFVCDADYLLSWWD